MQFRDTCNEWEACYEEINSRKYVGRVDNSYVSLSGDSEINPSEYWQPVKLVRNILTTMTVEKEVVMHWQC